MAEALRAARRLTQQGIWWAHDYAYAGLRVAESVRRHDAGPLGEAPPPTPGAAVGSATAAPPAPVVLVPGVYESWTFLRRLADGLHADGHAVHVLATLGHNRGPIADAAAQLGRYVAERGLDGVVVLAHSKGGLIGKLAMLREDPQGRIRGMVAVATPFHGSPLARWVPLRAVRAFRPTDAGLVALAAEQAVDARIVSVYGPYDPHIPGGSRLDGALANIQVTTPGHFRVLADPALPAIVRDAVARLSDTPAQTTV